MQEIVSCGPRPQQIMGGLWPQEIFGWPKGPARYLLLALGQLKIIVMSVRIARIILQPGDKMVSNRWGQNGLMLPVSFKDV